MHRCLIDGHTHLRHPIMGHSPRVSVIIPTFNRSAYLRQAIASVLVQSYADYEILVVNDGSTDNTDAVIAGFTDARIVCLQQRNAGRSAARNHALIQAKGEYVAFLDDDDLYLPDKLAKQVAFLDTHREIGLVAGGAQIIAASGASVRTWKTWLDQPCLTLPACLYSCPLLPTTVMLRRQWLEKMDHWFDTALERAEDIDIWVRLLLASCAMAWLPEIVSAYRQHSLNSQGDRERYYRSYLRILDKLYMRSDLPAPLLDERPALYAHYHVLGACQAYAEGQISTGKERLLHAAAAMPLTIEGHPPAMVASLVNVVQSQAAEDPAPLINLVFDHLPSPLANLEKHRRYALSALYMQRVFSARAVCTRPRFGDWLQGVCQYPQWLANRGVWSILWRDIVLAPIRAT